MPKNDTKNRDARVLIYSHDTFGLGHLRRCLTIAHALVDQNKDMSVIILTGSPIIGSFNFRARVDFVKIYSGVSPAGFSALVEHARQLGLDVAGHAPLTISAIEASEAGQRSFEHARVFLFN